MIRKLPGANHKGDSGMDRVHILDRLAKPIKYIQPVAQVTSINVV